MTLPADKDTTEDTVTGSDTEIVDDTTTTDDGNDGDAVRAELEDTRKALKKANREAADRRRKLEQYEKEDNERREAELSEIEKVTAKLGESPPVFTDLGMGPHGAHAVPAKVLKV